MKPKPVISSLRLRSANGSLNGRDPSPLPGVGVLAMSKAEWEVSLPAHSSITLVLASQTSGQGAPLYQNRGLAALSARFVALTASPNLIETGRTVVESGGPPSLACRPGSPGLSPRHVRAWRSNRPDPEPPGSGYRARKVP